MSGGNRTEVQRAKLQQVNKCFGRSRKNKARWTPGRKSVLRKATEDGSSTEVSYKERRREKIRVRSERTTDSVKTGGWKRPRSLKAELSRASSCCCLENETSLQSATK